MNELKTGFENEPFKILPEELAFDIDGVFADTFRAFVSVARKDYGVSIEYDEITEYEFWNVIDISQDDCMEIMQRILDYPLEIGIRPLDGAVKVLRRLARLGSVLFVSARPESDSILLWMNEYLGAVDPTLIRVEAVGGHEEKAPVLLKNGTRYFIEDRLETCYLLDRASVIPIVFDQPWNRRQHPFMTVKTWRNIEELIKW
ncbi:haloacid dehalogenase [Thermodesulfobacteriota bacterium]